MATANPPNGIVYFHYKASPYARRVCWYLALRNIEYAECMQPYVLPRPDLAALGVQYRRIPIMAIGRDVYVDTRLILRRLEELFPASAAHPALTARDTAGLAALLNKFVSDAGVFGRAAQIMAPDSPALRNAKFVEDRKEFFGPGWGASGAGRNRPEALVHMRQCFDIAEALFADGRRWVGGTEELSFADLEGVWCFDWIISDLAPPAEYFSAQLYPKVYDWRRRFMAAVKAAESRAKKPVGLKGAVAVPTILAADYTDTAAGVDGADPLGLQEGAEVKLFPTDGGGFTHQDQGRLVKLTKDEVAITVKAPGGGEVRIHAPRWQFRVQEVGGAPKL